MPIIRHSQDQDIDPITAIYAHHVHYGTGTFEIDPPNTVEMRQRRADVLLKHLPYLVIVDKGALQGFAYCNWFKPRPAYRYSAETSIYLAPDAAGKGLGRALLAELCRQSEVVGVRKLIAVIGDSANFGSIGVHRSVGFTPAGTLKACGWKFERWLDVVLMEKSLGLADSCAP